MELSIDLTSKLMLDTSLVEEKLFGALQNAGHLAAADLERVLAIVNETGVPALSAVSRLGLCAEEIAYEIMSEVIDWPFIQSNVACPSSLDIIDTAAQLGLSIDWCIDHHVFPVIGDDYIAVYTDTPLAKFPLNLVESLRTATQKKPHLLTPAMSATIIDEISQERAVSELFGEMRTDIAALAEEAPVINLVNSI